MTFARVTMSGIALLAILGAALCSAVFNLAFGSALGGSGVTNAFGYQLQNSDVFAAFSVSLDGAKLFMLALASYAAARGVMGVAWAGRAVWFACLVYSMLAAFGFAAINRADSSAERGQSTTIITETKAQISASRSELASLGSPRALNAIEAGIVLSKTNSRWLSTSGCTDITLKASRIFCAETDQLKVEAKASRRAAELRSEIAVGSKVLSRTVGKQADPQTSMLSQMTGWTEAQVRIGLVLIVAIVSEIVSSLGVFAVAGAWTQQPETKICPPSQMVDITPVSVENSSSLPRKSDGSVDKRSRAYRQLTGRDKSQELAIL